MPPHSGVLVGNDSFALGVYPAFSEAGRVIGDEVAVVGFGDHPFSAYLAPGLSSVRLPAEQVGAAAVDQLIARIRRRGSGEPRTRMSFPGELVVRGSSTHRHHGRRPREQLMLRFVLKRPRRPCSSSWPR